MPAIYGVVINSADKFTTSSSVILFITAPTTTAFVKVSNDSLLRDAQWETFTPTRDWTLSPDAGVRFVYAKFRDAERTETIETLSGPLRDYSGDVYHLEGVKAIAGEGRNFLTRSAGNFDLIQISLVDTWAATAAGAMALSENYLYTVEAFRLYFRKLSEGGLISTSRWKLIV